MALSGLQIYNYSIFCKNIFTFLLLGDKFYDFNNVKGFVVLLKFKPYLLNIYILASLQIL